MTDTQQAIKISMRIDASVYEAIKKEAQAEKREIYEHIQRLLTQHVIDKNLVEPATAEEYILGWSLVTRTVEMARQICREGGFESNITYKAIQACMADKGWAADYEKYVRDNPFKNGNPRKVINREIGFRIRAGIGGKIIKTSDGKPAKETVTGSIIQSFTPMKSYEPSDVL